MANEISLKAYEKNAKSVNRKGLLRDYKSIVTHYDEYVGFPSATATNKLVFEVTVDKGNVEDLIQLFEKEGFKNLGSINTYFLDVLVANYNKHRDIYRNINPEAVEAIEKDLKGMHDNFKPYKEVENDDAVFYVLGANDTIETFYEFVKTKKDVLLDYAKKNDITIMAKVLGFSDQIAGFFGVNFFDADKGDENEVIEYASRITVGVDFKDKTSVFTSALLLTTIGDSAEEMEDPEVNCHIVSDHSHNLK